MNIDLCQSYEFDNFCDLWSLDIDLFCWKRIWKNQFFIQF